MVYQYVKRYLKNNFVKPKEDSVWNTLENLKFFNYIDKRYTNEELSEEISEVKEAFKDFFEPVGSIVFRYKEDSGIKFKIFPYRVEPKDSKHLKTIVNIIKTNKKSIKYPYQDQNDQIAILGKIRRKINNEIADTQESVNKKELIRYAIRIALELGSRDIVVQLKRKYIVKIFQKNSVLEAEIENPQERTGAQNRFNGYTAQQIEETYKEIFVKGSANIGFFLRDVTKYIFKNKLNFREINNSYYEANALKIIHLGIAKELHGYISLEDDYILGVTGFLMRKHFNDIHELMATELMESVYEKSVNANNFLLYYNGKVILINDKKYKRPSLETEDGKQWNNSSLIGICNLWMNVKKKKEMYEHKLMDVDTKLEKINEELLYIEPEKKEQEDIIEEAEREALKRNKKHTELTAKLTYLVNTALNSSKYFAIIEAVKDSEVAVIAIESTIKDAKDNIKLIEDTNMSTYTDLEHLTRHKKQLLYDVKAQNLNIDTKSSQIDPIIQSIVKVLMARTKLVHD